MGALLLGLSMLLVVAAAALQRAASGNASARPEGGTIRLVAYSTPREAYGS